MLRRPLVVVCLWMTWIAGTSGAAGQTVAAGSATATARLPTVVPPGRLTAAKMALAVVPEPPRGAPVAHGSGASKYAAHWPGRGRQAAGLALEQDLGSPGPARGQFFAYPGGASGGTFDYSMPVLGGFNFQQLPELSGLPSVPLPFLYP